MNGTPGIDGDPGEPGMMGEPGSDGSPGPPGQDGTPGFNGQWVHWGYSPKRVACSHFRKIVWFWRSHYTYVRASHEIIF